jgi:hypothetical protein
VLGDVARHSTQVRRDLGKRAQLLVGGQVVGGGAEGVQALLEDFQAAWR